jgi:hypothetical protein
MTNAVPRMALERKEREAAKLYIYFYAKKPAELKVLAMVRLLRVAVSPQSSRGIASTL